MKSLLHFSCLFLLLLSMVQLASAQATYIPTTLPNGTENSSYVESLSIEIPNDTLLALGVPFGTINVGIDSAVITNISDIPPGLNINCADPSCVYINPPLTPAFLLDLDVTGTPTSAGTYGIDFDGLVYLTVPILGVITIPFNDIDAVSITIDAGTPTASVPTLSEWGLIVLSLLLCTMVTVAIRRKQIETI